MKRKKLYEEMTTMELFRSYLMSKLPRGKENLVRQQEELSNSPQNISINHIAVVLDNTVEEVLRCENRLAALLLSEPTFVEFDPENNYPKIGLTQYIEGNFVNPENENQGLTEEKVQSLLEDLKEKK